MSANEFSIDIRRYSESSAVDNWSEAEKISHQGKLPQLLGLSLGGERLLAGVFLAERILSVCEYAYKSLGLDTEDAVLVEESFGGKRAFFEDYKAGCLGSCGENYNPNRAHTIDLAINALVVQSQLPDLVGSSGKNRHIRIARTTLDGWGSHWASQLEQVDKRNQPDTISP